MNEPLVERFLKDTGAGRVPLEPRDEKWENLWKSCSEENRSCHNSKDILLISLARLRNSAWENGRKVTSQGHWNVQQS
jgi:hypothetical protein